MGKKPDKSPIGKIKLIDLPRALLANGLSVPYNQVYTSAVNGTIPAERTASGSRWVVDAKSLPQIIQHFSLMKDD